MRITFELSEKDLDHFRQVMKRARSVATETDDARIVAAARQLLAEVKAAKAPEFITDRLGKLQLMIEMVDDEGWALPAEERKRVLSALAYFSDPEDLIPDSIPGLGFLDDAIMIELVTRELKHEIEAYQDFRQFVAAESSRRKAKGEDVNRAAWLIDRRKQLHGRMRRRRSRTRTAGGRGRHPFSLF